MFPVAGEWRSFRVVLSQGYVLVLNDSHEGGYAMKEDECVISAIETTALRVGVFENKHLSLFAQCLRHCHSSPSSSHFVIITHSSSLRNTVVFLLQQYPSIIPNSILLHYPFPPSSSSLLSFTNLAFALHPSLSNPTTPPLFFNVVRHTGTLEVCHHSLFNLSVTLSSPSTHTPLTAPGNTRRVAATRISACGDP